MTEQATTTRPQTEIPFRMRHLPRDKHHHVVPWFVAWIDGQPDFRIIRENGIHQAIRDHTCWLCGKPMGRYTAFVIGPMCAVNRVTAEPGSHLDCALYAAQVCPFLANPRMQRRENGVEDAIVPAGVSIRRNPGVALVWVSRTWRTFPDGTGGVLIDVSQPESVHWFAEGRPATRAEVLASIDSGLPILREMCDQDDEPERSRAVLDRQHQAALALIPADIDYRHAPLTDEPCGVIPTPRGRRLVDAYRAHRTEQHPKAAADA